jgi:multisubunit Na+/H+ antiporter MnhB subunit
MNQGLSDALQQACFGAAILIFGGLISAAGILLVGLATGSAAVRRIRRLEPGILGRQAFWVVLGWGLGAVLAMVAVLYLASRVTS